MKKFNKEQLNKFKDADISGTTVLAFRDLEKLSNLYGIDNSEALDFGCGCGRSTKFLSSFCSNISGTDVCQESLDIARNRLINVNFFINDSECGAYGGSPYSAIYSIFVVCHFQSMDILRKELKKSFNSLKSGGGLIIVNGTKNLFCREYSTVKCISGKPNGHGARMKVLLKNSGCIVDDFFWDEYIVKEVSEQVGFVCSGIHYPTPSDDEHCNYKDELKYPPYYNICLKKN